MKQTLLVVLFLLCSMAYLEAQRLVSYEQINSYTAFEMAIEFGIPAQGGAVLYKVLYETPDALGVKDTASGLIVIPDQIDGSLPLLCHQHGTTSPRENVPSREQIHLGELFLASAGYVVSSADLLGMGDARGFHTYIHAATQASAAIDLLRATRAFCTAENIELNEQLFVTGYSQGGHGAMSVFKALEESDSDEFVVTAAAPMSGPYNVTGTMLNNTLQEEEYFFPSYLVYIAKGYQAAYGNIYEEITDIFKEPYASLIEQFDNQADYDLGALNSDLIALLTEREGASIPRYMIQDAVREAMLAEDINEPIVAALFDNNLYDWTPRVPMRMYYCEADEQVPYTNATFTDSLMNARGAADVQALSMGANLDHGGCAVPAYLATNTFFKSFEAAVNTKETLATSNPITIFPNPVANRLSWRGVANVQSVRIYDEFGRLLLQTSGRNEGIQVEHLPKGIYLLHLQTKDRSWTKRFILSE